MVKYDVKIDHLDSVRCWVCRRPVPGGTAHIYVTSGAMFCPEHCPCGRRKR